MVLLIGREVCRIRTIHNTLFYLDQWLFTIQSTSIHLVLYNLYNLYTLYSLFIVYIVFIIFILFTLYTILYCT